MPTVRLHAGHVRAIWGGHPWVLAQAIERVEGAPAPGDAVTVVDPRGRGLGRGYWSPHSAVPVRLLTTDPEQALDDGWLGRRIEQAAARRRELVGLPNEQTDAYRLVHAEGDQLGGLVVDLLGRTAVVHLHTAGMKRRADAIFAHVARITGARSVLEAPRPFGTPFEDAEGHPRTVRGAEVDQFEFRERGFELRFPLEVAHTPGYETHHRENRARIETLAEGRRVLDAFCYVGGFALSAARGGAREVLGIDHSAPLIATAATIARRNGLQGTIRYSCEDLRRGLQTLARRHRRFDLVHVDPPRLAPTPRHLESGRRGYRRLNTQALRLVERGGLLITCSSSPALGVDAFLQELGLAARKAGRSTTVLRLGHQGPDHPTPPAFAEGRYLKCAVIQVQ